MDKLGEQGVGLFVGRVEVMDLTIWIDNEDPAQIDADCSVRDCISVPVSETSMEWVELIREQTSNVHQSSYLEHLKVYSKRKGYILPMVDDE